MANYVYNRVVCTKAFFEEFFLDYKPFDEKNIPDSPYITFHKLFGLPSFYDYDLNYSTSIYNGFGFHWCDLFDGKVEIKFCTRWEYPIEVIIKALELGQNQIEWFACEENHVYISKFQWSTAGVEEFVYLLDDDYWDRVDKNEGFLGKLIGNIACDDEVWYLPLHNDAWKKRPDQDINSRYRGKDAYHADTSDIL